MVLSSALCRCQTPEPGEPRPASRAGTHTPWEERGGPVVRMRARTARLIEAREIRLTTYSPGRQPRLLRCGPMAPEADDMRGVARRAALIGGEVVGSGVRPSGAGAKGLPGDWVTEIDVASERAISGFLQAETPGGPVQGEELGGAASGLRWVVDPLDGTTNFLHGFWAVGVAVALVEEDTVLAGAVHAPFLGETWHAARRGGAVWERDGHA